MNNEWIFCFSFHTIHSFKITDTPRKSIILECDISLSPIVVMNSMNVNTLFVERRTILLFSFPIQFIPNQKNHPFYLLEDHLYPFSIY